MSAPLNGRMGSIDLKLVWLLSILIVSFGVGHELAPRALSSFDEFESLPQLHVSTVEIPIEYCKWTRHSDGRTAREKITSPCYRAKDFVTRHGPKNVRMSITLGKIGVSTE